MDAFSVKMIVNHINTQNLKCARCCSNIVFSTQKIPFLLSKMSQSSPTQKSAEDSDQNPDGFFSGIPHRSWGWHYLNSNFLVNSSSADAYICCCLGLNFCHRIGSTVFCFWFFIFRHIISECSNIVRIRRTWWLLHLSWRILNLPCRIRICPTLEIWVIYWISIFRMDRWWWIAFFALPVVAFLVHRFQFFSQSFIFFSGLLCLFNEQFPLLIQLPHHS